MRCVVVVVVVVVICAICSVSFATSDTSSQRSAKQANKVPRKKKDRDVSDEDNHEAPLPANEKASSSKKSVVKAKSQKQSIEGAAQQKSGDTNNGENQNDVGVPSDAKSAVKVKAKKVSSEGAAQQKSGEADNGEKQQSVGVPANAKPTVKATAKKGSSEGATQQSSSGGDKGERPTGADVPSKTKPVVKAKVKKDSTLVAEHQRSSEDLVGAASKSPEELVPNGMNSASESHPDISSTAGSNSKDVEANSSQAQAVKAKSETSSSGRAEEQIIASESGRDADNYESSSGSADKIPDAPKSKGVKMPSGKKSVVKAKPASGDRGRSTPTESDHEQSGSSEEHPSASAAPLQSNVGHESLAKKTVAKATPRKDAGMGNGAEVELSSGDTTWSSIASPPVTMPAVSGAEVDSSEVPTCAWTDDASCPAFSVGEFTVGQIGVDMCPLGSRTTVVRTSPACREAAAAMGFPWNTDVFAEGTECYVCLGCAKPLGPDTAMVRMNAAHGHLAKWICQSGSANVASTQARDGDDPGKAATSTSSSAAALGGTPKKVVKVPASVGSSARLPPCDGSGTAEVTSDGSVRLAQAECASADATSSSADLLQQRAVTVPKPVEDVAHSPEASKAVKVASSASRVKRRVNEKGGSPSSAVKAPVSARAPLSQPFQGEATSHSGDAAAPTLEIEKTPAAVAVKVPRDKKEPAHVARPSSATKVPNGKAPSSTRATKVAAGKVRASAANTPASATKVPSSASTKDKKVADASGVAADTASAGKRAPAERMLPFARAALHASRLDAVVDCTSWHSCLDLRAFQKAAQYGLNNAILARRNVDADRLANQPPGMGDALDKAVSALGDFNDRRTEDTFNSALLAFSVFFDVAGAWLAALPAASIKFSGTYNSVKLPAGDKGSVDVGRILMKLRSGGSMPMLGFGTQCLASREVGRSVRWALKAGFRHVAVDSGGGAEAALGEELTRFKASAAGTGANVFVALRLSDGVWHARGGTVAEALAAQLKALQVPYVDLLILPGPGSSPEVAAKIWREMEALHAGGRAKALGAANFSGLELEALMAGSRVLPDVALAKHSVYSSGPGAWSENSKDIVLHVARPKGTIVTAEGVLSGGDDSTPPPLEDPHVQALANVYGTTPAQLLLRWEAQRGLAVLPCSKVRERIEQDVDVFSFEIGEFDMALLSHLAQLAETTPGKTHRPPWTADVFALTAVHTT